MDRTLHITVDLGGAPVAKKLQIGDKVLITGLSKRGHDLIGVVGTITAPSDEWPDCWVVHHSPLNLRTTFHPKALTKLPEAYMPQLDPQLAELLRNNKDWLEANGFTIKPAERLKVGQRVKIVNTSRSDFGRTGKITHDDQTDLPFRVKFDDGDAWWFKPDQLEPAPPAPEPQFKPGDLVDTTNPPHVFAGSIMRVESFDGERYHLKSTVPGHSSVYSFPPEYLKPFVWEPQAGDVVKMGDWFSSSGGNPAGDLARLTPGGNTECFYVYRPTPVPLTWTCNGYGFSPDKIRERCTFVCRELLVTEAHKKAAANL